MSAQGDLSRAIALAIALASPAALAADGPPLTGATRAEALFQEGKRLLEQGSFTEACARLAASDALDPTVSTLGLLAGCHEQQGRIASAWREYRDTAKRAEAAGDGRAEFAKERAAALEPRLPRLLIRLPKASGPVEVLRDLERVPPGELGVEVPVDPGAYELVARAPERQEHRVTITAKEGARLVVELPELLPPGAKPPALPSSEPASARKPAPPVAPAPAAAPEEGNPRRTAALVAGGVGLAGLGVGLAFGASALSKNLESTTVRESCATPEACARGKELRDDAFGAAAAATVGLGVGVAGLATSVVLFLLPSSSTPAAPATGATKPAVAVAPALGAGSGGAVVSGTF